MTSKPTAHAKPNALVELFGTPRPIIGVVHARALPGAPSYEGEPVEDVYAAAVRDGLAYRDAGLHGLIVENHGDIPFAKPDAIGHETAATMSVLAERVRVATGLPIGINVLANAAHTALAVAKASQAGFVRVNEWANAYVANEGFIEGPAGSATRYRAWLRARDVRIFADVHVKHGAHAIVADRSLEELVRDAEFFDADVLIATGQRTGDAASIDEVAAVKAAAALPVVVGSGVDEANAADILSVADGAIIASSLKRDGVWWNEVDPDRARSFMDRVAAIP
ncbi:MAG: BtpA/SgcQ family protein [Chloroflexota bacterium]